MNHFTSIKELLQTLNREHRLLTEMFEKRKLLAYRYDYALELVDYKEDRIQYLIEHGVIRKNAAYLEIDDDFVQFFEQVLAVNEDINEATIHANIEHVTENILYYLKENNESRKYAYLRSIKTALRKIGNQTLRNVVDLKRNTDNTFKNEINFQIKKIKLEKLDEKRNNINDFISQTSKLINEDEITFFKTALDDEMHSIILQLQTQLNDAKHNLIEIQKQIIEYINQINYQSMLFKKLRAIKYLKDRFTLRAESNIEAVIAHNNALIFEHNPSYPLKLSLNFLASDDAYATIKKVAKNRKNIKVNRLLAAPIDAKYFASQNINEFYVNLEEVKNSFLASGNNLFDFILSYDFKKQLSLDEKVTIYCQLISQYGNAFKVSQQYNSYKAIEYAIVYPK